MKATFSLRRHHYLKAVSVFLIAVFIIAGIVGCEPGETYDLTMAVNPGGAGTATDLTGTSPYGALTSVNISAVPACGYGFVEWTAPAGIFGDKNAAQTTFIMPTQDVTVTAHFEPVPANHFKFYTATGDEGVGVDVQLVDQFGNFTATVGYPTSFGNPVEKTYNDTVTPISDPNLHYTVYDLAWEEEPQSWKVVINNQFQDDVELTVQGPVALAVPTEKLEADLGASACGDHLLLYSVMYEPFSEFSVHLKDQFIEEDVTVTGPAYFANPVQKTVIDTTEVADVKNPDDHWLFYYIEEEEESTSIGKTIQIDNQFGLDSLDLTWRETLAVPTQKISWEQPLDHFRTYNAEWADEPPMYGENVLLEDQLTTVNATVWQPYFFANPTTKVRMVDEEEEVTPISNWNNHLTFYAIDYEGPPMTWEVTVDNQFGKDQVLDIEGPYLVAVPTRKGPQDPPRDLDHYLVYFVSDYYWYPEEEVYLWDQFTSHPVTVVEPYFFAIPAQKTHGDVLTPVKNSKDHLVFYNIYHTGDFYLEELPIGNQFGPQLIGVYENSPDLLGVPSEKTAVEGPWSPI